MTITTSYQVYVMTEDDWHTEAVRSKSGAEKNLKHFAECCANVSDKRTAALAGDCKCSVDTIERYRNAYKLYYQMCINFESEHVRKLWESASIELWKKAAEIRNRYDLSLVKIFEYLQTGDNSGMSRESFSAHIDEKENKIPKWIRRLQDIARKLRPMKYDWKTEIPVTYRAEFEQATEQYAAVLEKIANAGMEES